MPTTLREKFIAALIARGETEVKHTFKYVVFTRNLAPDTFYYVGRNGALRAGRTIASSFPMSDAFKQKLLNGGDK